MSRHPDLHLSRRHVLGGALAAGAALALPPVAAQSLQTHLPPGVEPHVRGPLVFLDYDQDELDLAYDQGPWADRTAIDRRIVARNEEAIARLGAPRRLAYGTGDAETLDLYAARGSGLPIHVFIHGGAWRVGRAEAYAYHAKKYVAAGAHFIALDFNNVLETGGDLLPMASQVRRAVAWIYRNASSFGGDPERLYVSGHSSGGHLAAVVLTTDWEQDYGLPPTVVRGGVLASAMYDLYPVSLSARSDYVRFTPEVIEALSPLRRLEWLAAPVIVGHGTAETPEFQRQSREFVAAAEAAGKPLQYIVREGLNHFEIVEDLGIAEGVLGQAALEQMGLELEPR